MTNKAIKLTVLWMISLLSTFTYPVVHALDASIPTYNSITGTLHIPVLKSEDSEETWQVDLSLQPNSSEETVFVLKNAQPAVHILPNPMDWVGQAHNGGVLYVLEKLKSEFKTMPSDPEILSKRIKELAVEYAGFSGNLESIKHNKDLTSQVAIEKKLAEGAISKVGAEFLTRLFTILSKLDAKANSQKDIFAKYQQSYSLSEIIESIQKLEVEASKVLIGSDLKKFYEVSSVAKHSATLWAPKEQGGLDGIHSLGELANPDVSLAEVVAADIIIIIIEGPDWIVIAIIESVIIAMMGS